MECQYVATQRGGIALLYEGHRYNKVRDGKEGTVYWRCARDRQCPGRAVTVYSRIKKANNKHNHPPDAWRNKVDQVVSDLKLRSQEEITPLPTLFTETLKYLAVNPQMTTLTDIVPSLSAIKAVEHSQNRRMPALVPFRELTPEDDWMFINMLAEIALVQLVALLVDSLLHFGACNLLDNSYCVAGCTSLEVTVLHVCFLNVLCNEKES